jgi:eukaryotic-like serine/threonine-protein kinase
MGEVYVGFDTTLQRKVASKAVRRDRRLDEEARARLLREARMLSHLHHPNIRRVYDYVSDDEHDFIVLELIEGSSLRDGLSQPLHSHAKMRVAEQVVAALVAAHAAGVIHRDLKPENVMLLPSGDVKVLDFGLAPSAASQTRAPLGNIGFADRVVSLDSMSETLAPGADGMLTRGDLTNGARAGHGRRRCRDHGERPLVAAPAGRREPPRCR